MYNVLQAIIQKKRKERELLKKRDFYSIFHKRNKIVFIGEIKCASPSDSQIGLHQDLIAKAKEYEKNGIFAISVITEKHFFQGDTQFVPSIKMNTSVPILQKDFIIDSSQVYEAKALGSDALLLIARIINTKQLKEFVSLAYKLGIEPIVEVHSRRDLQKAEQTATRVIAVNARDLDTFKIDLEKACHLLIKIPKKYIRLGFSGILSRKEISMYKKAGAQGILVGTALMKTNNVRNFIGGLNL